MGIFEFRVFPSIPLKDQISSLQLFCLFITSLLKISAILLVRPTTVESIDLTASSLSVRKIPKTVLDLSTCVGTLGRNAVLYEDICCSLSHYSMFNSTIRFFLQEHAFDPTKQPSVPLCIVIKNLYVAGRKIPAKSSNYIAPYSII